MASSALQKLIRSQSQSAKAKITTHLRGLHPQSPLLTLIPQITKPIDVDEPHFFNSHSKSEHLQPNRSYSHVYPSFCFGYFLDPMCPTSIIRSEHEEKTTPDDDTNVIRADSVKKKRKKKMNKHKLRKLRKRLRRKTKT